MTISDATLDKLSAEQKNAVFETVREIRPENRKCVEDETNEILDDWRTNGPVEVIEEDEPDREAFIEGAEACFQGYYTGDDLAFYDSIRDSAE